MTASAGNHGMSVAAGARVFGAKAVVYIAETVPEGFAGRLRDMGADVVRAGTDYAASMKAAETAASDNGWTLLSDSSWPGYVDLPWRLMEGYLVMAEEAVRQMPEVPTHVFCKPGSAGWRVPARRCFGSAGAPRRASSWWNPRRPRRCRRVSRRGVRW